MWDRHAEEAVIAAVRQAARSHILPRYRALPPSSITSKSRPDDLVTEADLAVEAALTQSLPAILPGTLVLGEEAAATDPGLIRRALSAESCMILDPVDGTWNFARGVSVFGTILAHVQAEQTTWGLLYDPLMDDWIVARRGQGVDYVRPGQSPRACRLADPATAEGQLGIVAPALFPPPRRAALSARIAERFDRTLTLRCSCHEYRLLLQGTAGWLLAPDPMPWDHAAGVCAVTALGGHAAFIEDGAPYTPARQSGTLLVAGSAAHWAEIRDLTRV